jgi:hypothetical protein
MEYPTGQSVSVGDRVKLWADRNGTIVCSIHTGEFGKKYPESEWGYLNSGVMIETDSGEVLHYIEADEDLELISVSHAKGKTTQRS